MANANLDATGGRLMSLDAFRGATIAGMILVNNGIGPAIYPQLRHAEWHGWTFTDVIFPFFLWIVGVSITLSFAKRLKQGSTRRKLLGHVFWRAVVIFAIGLFLNGYPYFHLSTLRIPGVLQRIAVCYLVAGLIFLFSRVRGQIAWTVGLLASYVLLMQLVTVPGYGGGVWEQQGNLAAYVDSLLLSGHMYRPTWDPEGIISTLPAISTTLFGILTGHLLRSEQTAERRTVWIFLLGNLLLLAGFLLGRWVPVNKNLWTSSYALLMAGLAANVFACCYWLVDVLGYKKWAKPFAVYGMNAITVYGLSQLLAKTLGAIKLMQPGGVPISLSQWIYQQIFVPLASPMNAALLYALSFVLLFYLVAQVMYWRKWFVKI